jgi:hypothetical protein
MAEEMTAEAVNNIARNKEAKHKHTETFGSPSTSDTEEMHKNEVDGDGEIYDASPTADNDEGQDLTNKVKDLRDALKLEKQSGMELKRRNEELHVVAFPEQHDSPGSMGLHIEETRSVRGTSLHICTGHLVDFHGLVVLQMPPSCSLPWSQQGRALVTAGGYKFATNLEWGQDAAGSAGSLYTLPSFGDIKAGEVVVWVTGDPKEALREGKLLEHFVSILTKITTANHFGGSNHKCVAIEILGLDDASPPRERGQRALRWITAAGEALARHRGHLGSIRTIFLIYGSSCDTLSAEAQRDGLELFNIDQARLLDPGGSNLSEVIGEAKLFPLTDGVLEEAASDLLAIEAVAPSGNIRFKQTARMSTGGNAETIRKTQNKIARNLKRVQDAEDKGIEPRVTRSQLPKPALSPGL